MRIITILLFTLTYSFQLFGQEDTTFVPFVSYWSIGDSYDFQITKIKKSWKNEEFDNIDSSAYLVNFSVMDSTDKSYLIKWSFSTDLSSYQIPEDLMDNFQKYKITEVIYETTELGEFVEIKNWKDISKQMLGLFDDLEFFLIKQNKTKVEELKEALLPIREIYTSKQGIEQLVFKELQYFHFPFGLEYAVDEEIEYETLLPNMFGGEPIKGDTKLYIDAVDFENDYCIMIQEMELSEKDTKELMNSLFKKMKLKKSFYKEFIKKSSIEINDFNVFEYFYFPGVPYRIETNRMVKIQFDGRTDSKLETTRIELILD